MSNLELNKGDQFIFGVDVSASMNTADCPNGAKRIDFLKEQVVTFAKEASKYDTDGIDVLTFGHKITEYRNVTAEKAEQVISGLAANEGSTDTALLVKTAYALHKARNDDNQTVLFIATDGAPNDRDALKTEIVAISNDIKDEHEFAISFLTVGEIDAGLAEFLKDLDDNLTGAKHDIVDVKALHEVDFITAFIGALHD